MERVQFDETGTGHCSKNDIWMWDELQDLAFNQFGRSYEVIVASSQFEYRSHYRQNHLCKRRSNGKVGGVKGCEMDNAYRQHYSMPHPNHTRMQMDNHGDWHKQRSRQRDGIWIRSTIRGRTTKCGNGCHDNHDDIHCVYYTHSLYTLLFHTVIYTWISGRLHRIKLKRIDEMQKWMVYEWMSAYNVHTVQSTTTTQMVTHRHVLCCGMMRTVSGEWGRVRERVGYRERVHWYGHSWRDERRRERRRDWSMCMREEVEGM